MIKFPTTVSEYTDGELWHKGVDESIARRIIVNLSKIEDEDELDLRKMYLAYFYCDIGEYGYAMTIAKQFLLENKLVDDAILLIKKICLADKDVDNFARLIKLTNRIYRDKPPLNLFDDSDDFDVFTAAYDDKETGKGRVVYDGNTASYYQYGNLIFSVKDKNYEAFIKDSAARYMLSENRPQEAIDLFSNMDLSKLKTSVRLFCHRTLMMAYCMQEEFDKAYDHCAVLMENDVYMPEMADIFTYLYNTDSPYFAEMKKFFLGYKHFGSLQLGDMHSLARDIDDEDFWKTIYKNNPIDPSDVSDETYVFKGILEFNMQEYGKARAYFNKANALYGNYGKARLYGYYLDCFQKKLKKNPIIDDMPYELYTARIDDVYDFIDKKLRSKLKKCLSREDFVKNADDNMLELDNMLSGLSTEIRDIVDVVYRVYSFGYLPARDLIDKVAVDDEYNFIIRSVCLAVFMLHSKSKKMLIGDCVYENPFVGMLKKDGGKDKVPFAYGIAIYFAFSLLTGISAKDFKEEYSFLKKIYLSVKGDFTTISPLAVFGTVIAFMCDEKVHYDKDAIKKREVKDFASAYVNGTVLSDCVEKIDEDFAMFFKFCIALSKK